MGVESRDCDFESPAKMKFLALLSLLVVASSYADEQLVIDAAFVQNNQVHEGVVKIVINNVPRAPFPVQPSVPPARIAVMQMMANCKGEAFKSCGAKPMVPLCPKKLAFCLLALKSTLVSPACRIALKPVAALFPKTEKAVTTHLSQTANKHHGKKNDHSSHHKKFMCRIKHALKHLVAYFHQRNFWLGFLITLSALLSIFALAVITWRHCCGIRAEELAAEEQRQLTIALEISAAEAYTKPSAPPAEEDVVHVGTPVVQVVVANSSELQV